MKVYESHRIVEAIKEAKEGDELMWDEPSGEVYVIKLLRKYVEAQKE